MKKYIFIPILSLVLCFGCSKDFLEPEQFNSITADKFYESEERLDLATRGVYKYLQSTGDFQAKGLYGFDMWVFADVAADLVDARNFSEGQNPEDIQRGVQTPTNSTLERVWSRNYVVIRRANDVIRNAANVPGLSEAKKNKYLGELRFLRALSYFNLIRVFGGRPHVAGEDRWGIPMMTEAITSVNDDFIRERGTVTEAYNFIIADLEFAAQHLDPTRSAEELGRVTRGAAWGLLAKVYMTKAGTSGNQELWTKSLEYAQKVIDLGIYGLWQDPGVMDNAYATLFKVVAENSRESLFEIQNTSFQYGFGESFNNMLAPDGKLAQNNKGWAYPTQELVDMYEPGDIRKSASIFQKGDNFWPDRTTEPLAGYTYDPAQGRGSLTGYHVKKYITGRAFEDMWETGPANVRVLRYAEMLLIKAEALNELGSTADAFMPLNEVRERAGLEPITTASQDELREAIWKERGLELFMEGDRWFDLKRTDRLLERMKAINNILPKSLTDPTNSEAINAANFNTDKHYIMAIPQGEVDLSNNTLVQADGY